MQVSVEEFLAKRKANPKSVVIDVRDSEKFQAGHIPGAIAIHKTVIAEEIATLIPDKDTEIFCYCGGGQSGPRSAEALNRLGYKNAKAIEGGFRGYSSHTKK